MNFKGAIFDLDGTLLDSMHIWENIGFDYLKHRNIRPDPDIWDVVRAMYLRQFAEYLHTEYSLPESPDEIVSQVVGMIERQYTDVLTLKDGAAPLLHKLHSRGVKMSVATATDRPLVEAALKRNGVLPYFEQIFTCSEVGAGKDSPDIYFSALRSLGTDIGETLVFEDALYAVRTAKNAGFTVAAVHDKSARHHEDEIKALADVYIKNFHSWHE